MREGDGRAAFRQDHPEGDLDELGAAEFRRMRGLTDCGVFRSHGPVTSTGGGAAALPIQL